MHHAVRELRAVELRAAPLHAGIGGAFAEIRPVDARHALDVVEREDQRLVDEAVQDQPVVGGIDSAMPAWWRSKHSPLGVITPSSACSGVKLTELCGVAVSHATSRRIAWLHVWMACRICARRRRRPACASNPRCSAAGSPGCRRQRPGGPARWRRRPPAPVRRKAATSASGIRMIAAYASPQSSGRPAAASADDANVIGLLRSDAALLPNVIDDDVPDRRACALVHARPAGDDVVLRGERFALVRSSVRSETRLPIGLLMSIV